jgi:cytochrome c553
MARVGQYANDEDVKAAAEYFSGLKFSKWIRVVESKTAPKSQVVAGYMLAAIEGAGSEPIGARIIEIPEDLARTELRDPRSGFVAYVPVGSIKRGASLITTGGGKTIPCVICHGPELKGLGLVPSLAGRSPSYIVRQLYDIKNGNRAGVSAQLMKDVVAKLTLDDMVAIAAYTASREP